MLGGEVQVRPALLGGEVQVRAAKFLPVIGWLVCVLPPPVFFLVFEIISMAAVRDNLYEPSLWLLFRSFAIYAASTIFLSFFLQPRVQDLGAVPIWHMSSLLGMYH